MAHVNNTVYQKNSYLMNFCFLGATLKKSACPTHTLRRLWSFWSTDKCFHILTQYLVKQTVFALVWTPPPLLPPHPPLTKRKNLGGKCTRYECFWKHASLFCWHFIETDTPNNFSPKAPAKVEGNLETWWRVGYYYYYPNDFQSLSELHGFNWSDPRSLHWIELPQSVCQSSTGKLEMLVRLNAALLTVHFLRIFI